MKVRQELIKVENGMIDFSEIKTNENSQLFFGAELLKLTIVS